MTVSVTHSTNVVVADDGVSPVGSDEWNAAHTITGSAWTSGSATIAAQTGTLTSASGTIRYEKVGRIVFYDVSYSVTTAGTGTDALTVQLPFTVAASDYPASLFRANGQAALAKAIAGSTALAIWGIGYTSVIANGESGHVCGFYEATS